MDWPIALPIKVLQVRNPCYSEADNDLAAALYHGGRLFDALKDSCLDPRSADGQGLSVYRKSRLRKARYENHIANGFDHARNIAFQAAPRLVFSGPPDKLKYYNTLNDGLHDVLEGRFTDMQLYGYGLLTASYPASPLPAVAANRGQQLAAGALDAKICWLCPDAVEDWDCDSLGNLVWLKIHTEEPVRKNEVGEIDGVVHTWTFITQTEKAIYQKTLKKNESLNELDSAARVNDVTPLAFGLPIFETSLINRGCLMARVSDTALGLYNAEADYTFAVHQQCYAVDTYAGTKEPNEFSNKIGDNVVLFLGQGGVFERVVPSNVAFDSIRNLVMEKQAKLDALINQEFKNLADKDQHAASGAAKQEDKEPATLSAETYTRKIIAALRACVDYIRISRGDYDPETGEEAVTWRLEGMNDFSPLALSEKIANLAAYKAISGAAPTALKIAQRNLDHAMTPGATPEESTAIDKENANIEAPAPSAISSSATAFSQSGAAASSGTSSSGATTTTARSAATSSSASGASTSSAASSGDPGDKRPPIEVSATLKQIDPKRVNPQHSSADEGRQDITANMRKDGYDQSKPILAVEIPGLHAKDGPIYKSLDGHHRTGGAKILGLKKIPAYVIAFADWLRLTAAFPTDPSNLSQLDKYIRLPDGRTYDQVREANSHTNGPVSSAATSAASSARSVAV